MSRRKKGSDNVLHICQRFLHDATQLNRSLHTREPLDSLLVSSLRMVVGPSLLPDKKTV